MSTPVEPRTYFAQRRRLQEASRANRELINRARRWAGRRHTATEDIDAITPRVRALVRIDRLHRRLPSIAEMRRLREAWMRIFFLCTPGERARAVAAIGHEREHETRRVPLVPSRTR